MSGPKRVEVTDGSRNLHDDELHNIAVPIEYFKDAHILPRCTVATTIEAVLKLCGRVLVAIRTLLTDLFLIT
jgi:hypothetical protein